MKPNDLTPGATLVEIIQNEANNAALYYMLRRVANKFGITVYSVDLIFKIDYLSKESVTLFKHPTMGLSFSEIYRKMDVCPNKELIEFLFEATAKNPDIFMSIREKE